MVVSSAVRSSRRRSVGTRTSSSWMCCQYDPETMGLSCQPRPDQVRAPTLAGVPSLTELVRVHTDLDDDDVAWLHRLQADWQIIADLSFADLVLWLPDREGRGFWAGGQMRPTTGPTAYVDDIVGTFVAAGRRPHLDI